MGFKKIRAEQGDKSLAVTEVEELKSDLFSLEVLVVNSMKAKISVCPFTAASAAPSIMSFSRLKINK